MVRENLIICDPSEQIYVCNSCDNRDFTSENSLLHHCREAKQHRGQFCGRCKRLFVHITAKHNHITNSSRHWVCHICDIDLEDEDSLESHLSGKHSYCYDCGTVASDFRQHRAQYHHECSVCEDQFQDANALLMVWIPLQALRGGVDLRI